MAFQLTPPENTPAIVTETSIQNGSFNDYQAIKEKDKEEANAKSLSLYEKISAKEVDNLKITELQQIILNIGISEIKKSTQVTNVLLEGREIDISNAKLDITGKATLTLRELTTLVENLNPKNNDLFSKKNYIKSYSMGK